MRTHYVLAQILQTQTVPAEYLWSKVATFGNMFLCMGSWQPARLWAPLGSWGWTYFLRNVFVSQHVFTSSHPQSTITRGRGNRCQMYKTIEKHTHWCQIDHSLWSGFFASSLVERKVAWFLLPHPETEQGWMVFSLLILYFQWKKT